MASSSNNLLELTGVRKRFGNVVALDGASVRLRAGEVRALIGGNGSGKSTLSMVLLGILKPDEATLSVGGAVSTHYGEGPWANEGLRVAGTFQEVSLLDDLTVAENLHLTRLPRKFGILSSPARRKAASAELLDRVLLPRTILDRKVRELPLDQRALAELAKVLLSDPQVLIMDELTASLRAEQVDQVGGLLGDLSARGVAVLFVSHRLEEVEEFCTSCTVLRNGTTVLEADDIREHSIAEYVAAMTATEDSAGGQRVRRVSAAGAGATVLDVKRLTIPGCADSISLRAGAGEIIGLGGLAGNGQAEALRAIFGAMPAATDYHVSVADTEIRRPSVRTAIASGMGFMSGEREREMSFGQRSVEENLRVVAHGLRRTLSSPDLLRRMKTKGSPRAQMKSLSGGNQQKVIVGRWLGIEPKALLADDPTRGVDVATREEIHQLLRELTDRGSAVVLTSSDDRELADICDRVYIMYRGRVIAELEGDAVTEEEIGRISVHPAYQEKVSG